MKSRLQYGARNEKARRDGRDGTSREQEKAKFDREIRLKVAEAKEKAEVSILC